MIGRSYAKRRRLSILQFVSLPFCQVAQDRDRLPFEIDHIIGENHGSTREHTNLCLCNAQVKVRRGKISRHTKGLLAVAVRVVQEYLCRTVDDHHIVLHTAKPTFVDRSLKRSHYNSED